MKRFSRNTIYVYTFQATLMQMNISWSWLLQLHRYSYAIAMTKHSIRFIQRELYPTNQVFVIWMLSRLHGRKKMNSLSICLHAKVHTPTEPHTSITKWGGLKFFLNSRFSLILILWLWTHFLSFECSSPSWTQHEHELAYICSSASMTLEMYTHILYYARNVSCIII